VKLIIRLLEEQDIPQIAEAFQQLGWNKPASRYERYLKEQNLGTRNVYVAFVDVTFAGYITICWKSTYPPFLEAQIPEIVDFNVLPKYRRQGIGVGMDANYGAAQRLYVLRDYIPDGRGLYSHGHHLKYGEQVTVDDGLALYFTKQLN